MTNIHCLGLIGEIGHCKFQLDLNNHEYDIYKFHKLRFFCGFFALWGGGVLFEKNSKIGY